MKLKIFLGLLIITVSSARVVREAPQTEEVYPLENFLENFQTGFKELEKMALNAAGLENTDEVKQRAKEHIDFVSNLFSSFVENVKQETEKLKESEVVKELRETVEKHAGELKGNADERIAKFKEEHPETYTQISGQIDSLKSVSHSIVDKIKDLTQTEESQKIKDATIKFIADVKESLTTLAKDQKTEEEKKE